MLNVLQSIYIFLSCLSHSYSHIDISVWLSNHSGIKVEYIKKYKTEII